MPRRRAIIVGAGIGGIASAIALRRDGWEVVILEAAPAIAEVGAGIQIPPNAAKVVISWGLKSKIDAVGCRPQYSRVWRYNNLAPLAKWPFSAEEVFGVPYWHIHRADYHKLLYDEAVAPTLAAPAADPGPPVQMLVNANVTEANCDTATVKTADGRTFSGDVLIGADGVKSILKGFVTGEPDPAKPTGDQAYRFLIPMERIKKHPDLEFATVAQMNVHAGPTAHIVHYPVSNFKYVNVVACCLDDQTTIESWDSQGSQADLLRLFQGWSPQILKLMSLSDTYLKWRLIKRTELSTWTRGKTTLLGDACHATLPYVAQGAAQAVEDAAALAIALKPTELPVNEALRAYEAVRKPRTSKVVSGGDGARVTWHRPDGPEQMVRDDEWKKDWDKASRAAFPSVFEADSFGFVGMSAENSPGKGKQYEDTKEDDSYAGSRLDFLTLLPAEVSIHIPLLLVPADLENFRNATLASAAPSSAPSRNADTPTRPGLFPYGRSWFIPSHPSVSQATIAAEAACRTLCTMAQVSKAWNLVANDPRVWKSLYRLLLSDKHKSSTPPSAHPHHLCNFTMLSALPSPSPLSFNYPSIPTPTLNHVLFSLSPSDICSILRERVFRGLWKPSDLDAPYGGLPPARGSDRWKWKNKIVRGVRKMVLERVVKAGRLGDESLPLLHLLLHATYPTYFAPLIPEDLIFRNKWKWSYAVARVDAGRTFVTMDELTRMTWTVRFANPSWMLGWDDFGTGTERRVRARHLRDGHLIWENEVVLSWRFLGDSEGPQPMLSTAAISTSPAPPSPPPPYADANRLPFPTPLPDTLTPLPIPLSTNVVARDNLQAQRIQWHVWGRERFVRVEGYPAKTAARTAHWGWILFNRNVAYEPQSVSDPQPLPKKRSAHKDKGKNRASEPSTHQDEDDLERKRGRKRYTYSYEKEMEESDYGSSEDEDDDGRGPGAGGVKVDQRQPNDAALDLNDMDESDDDDDEDDGFDWEREVEVGAHRRAVALAAAAAAAAYNDGGENEEEDNGEEEEDEGDEDMEDGDDGSDKNSGSGSAGSGGGSGQFSMLEFVPGQGLVIHIGIPNNARVLSLAWDNQWGYIACGGDAGLLKVLKLETAGAQANAQSSTATQESIASNEKAAGSSEKLAGDLQSGSASSSSLSMNQTLSGHSNHVTLIRWNAAFTKLTTADASGLIIVWIMYKGAWYEEMVNNRGKSTVADMRWDPEGKRICIAYRDGTVIAGSVDGARLWSKNLSGTPVSLAWSPDGTLLLFAMESGEIQVWDYNGGVTGTVEAIAKPTTASTTSPISCMEWHPCSSPSHQLATPNPSLAIALSSGTILLFTSNRDLTPLSVSTPLASPILSWNSTGTILAAAGLPAPVQSGSSSPQDKSVPHLLLLSPQGVLLRHLRIPGKIITSLAWDASTGDMRLAVGVDGAVYFVNVRYDKWDIWGWCEDTDPRRGAAGRTGVGGGSVVYSWKRGEQKLKIRPSDDNEGWGVGWWNIETGARVVKSVRHLLLVRTHPSAVLIVHTSTSTSPLTLSLSEPPPSPSSPSLQITATITSPAGTTIATVQLASAEFAPTAAAVTSTHVHIGGGAWVASWEYNKPKATGGTTGGGKMASVIAKIAALDAARKGSIAPSLAGTVEGVRWWTVGEGREKAWTVGAGLGGWNPEITTDDPIVSITASESTLVVARTSGTLFQFSLPSITLQHIYTTGLTILHVAINLTGSMSAILDTANVCRVVQLSPNSTAPSWNGKTGASTSNVLVPVPAAVLPIAQKDVMSLVWSSDMASPELLAVADKSRLLVFSGPQMKSEEPTPFTGWLLGFRGLEVIGVVGLEQVARDPDDGWDKSVLGWRETEAVRKVKDSVTEVLKFVEANPHPRLWRLVADTALDSLDLQMAMRAFVNCKDWGGITLVKRVKKLDDKRKQQAEIATYYGNFQIAESIYLSMDRPDLAFDMHVEVGNYSQALKLLHPPDAGTKDAAMAGRGAGATSPKRPTGHTIPVSDKQMIDLYELMGDQCRDAGKWEEALAWYKRSNNAARMVECLYMTEDWDGLTKMVEVVEDGEVLKDLASKCSTVGLWEAATAGYIKAGYQKAAVETCISLNQWSEALRLADGTQVDDVREAMQKVVAQLLERGRKMECVAMYRGAGMHGRAAALLFEVANEYAKRPDAELLSIKKLFVLAALEASRYKDSKRSPDAFNPHGSSTLDALLTAPGVSSPMSGAVAGSDQDLRLPSNPWKAAEGWHLYMAAQKQFYKGECEDGYITALQLKAYDDVLDPRRVYALVAILAVQTGRVATGGKALGKLESLERAKGQEGGGEVGKWKAMAKEIFGTYPPTDNPAPSSTCSNCASTIPSSSTACPHCLSTFPLCVASGRPIIDDEDVKGVVVCGVCRHRVGGREWKSGAWRWCPLCHAKM
ncbi:hypothetical protein M427DRAFT_68207 [Gonapodya prolifera JEL478]|uniref:Uncharacterized protein n=1 Tax=Gonapodya prolifera (strain JEL478) TaxID=1344416 RepID=A0A139ALM3_GONPJ|nr:hypothetical protein M427DRAFT_68207 [Gonapodya prolifera JEL478]|eukprot:KXS17686.1 hypothetical protein M427DRAFT_68207 [Gonapodya prolifera JEL478]